MKENKLEKLDLSFLPGKLATERKKQINTALISLNRIRWPIKAIVLGGGYKHKELTYNGDRIGSDVDLYVFSNFIPLFWRELLKIQKEINKPKPFLQYAGVIPLFLLKSKTFLAYRLKHEGIVLRGNEDIFQKIKAEENNIPRIEAIRILFQTLVMRLMLNELEHTKSGAKVNPFIILRSYLNIGESYLIFFGHLKPSYKERMHEFKKRFQEFGVAEELVQKIILGYLTKTNSTLAKGYCNFWLSFSQAKKDCLKAIDDLLSLYLNDNSPLDDKLEILSKKTRLQYLFNLAFFYFLKDIQEIKPKFFPIIFQFKITDLYKIVVYSEENEKEKLLELLNKYFKVQKFTNETLIKIYKPIPYLP